MQIEKRNGSYEVFLPEKITSAMHKAFIAAGQPVDETVLTNLTQAVSEAISQDQDAKIDLKVERVQDLVEEILMKNAHYKVAKIYILYRSQRQALRYLRHNIIRQLNYPGLEKRLESIQNTYQEAAYSLEFLSEKFQAFFKAGMTPDEGMQLLIRAASELTTQEAPKWEYIASTLAALQYHHNLAQRCEAAGIRQFSDKVAYLEKEGLYGRYIREHYTDDELNQASEFIDDTRDELLTISAFDLLTKRYVISDHQHRPYESPQELFLGISLHLGMKEDKSIRLDWVKQFYDMLSLLQVTMATPTMSNARKPYHQLSSCFIDTVPDSLSGIYRSITNFSQVSKFGGGMGMYFGKVRAIGSSIRGFKGVAGGVIRWIKLANDTAVAVDQLGVRQGSVAVYLDAWHRDLPEFLQLRTNNGDDRMKAHDIFPAVCYPDYFWEQVRDNMEGDWYLMCPHEIRTIKGYNLEDSYGDEWKSRYLDCVQDPRIHKRVLPIKEIVRMVLKSSVETGTPFAFFRDTVNRANPNPHKGIIYCSNLCTEIAQNMSEIEAVSLEIKTESGDTVVVEKTRPGDFVVCNLASLVLGHIDVTNQAELRRITQAAIRALDNVIDLNYYPLPYAQHTNQHYRSLGLGVSGYHHMLAKAGIRWESDEHLQFVDEVFENINYAAIEASCQLAQEKGKYPYFDGSDWDTGDYFQKRNYNSERWQALKDQVHKHGMRNAYLIAIAPTSSTSIIAGTSAGLDPIMKRYFLEEKKGAIMPRVAPDLTHETFWLYKQAHQIDQSWSMKAAGIRQRHVDQAQSLNLYVTQDLSFRQILSYFQMAWEAGVKTIYYCRSLSLEVVECESCSA